MARGTRKSTVSKRMANKRRKGFAAFFVPWLKRFGIALASFSLVLWLGAWFFLSDADTRTADWIREGTMQKTAALGFQVENILVEGRVHTDPDVLMTLLNIKKGDPLFAFDPAEVKEQVEKITWVDYARVERRWPDTLYIGLAERKPLALWQENKDLKLLDTEGAVIAAGTLSPFKDLLIVIGNKAPENAPELVRYLSSEPEILSRVEAAIWIDDRRWDLTLDNKVKIKMPEDDFGLALASLALEQKEQNILDKDVLSIDMRKQGRIIVRTQPGAVKEYKAGFSSGQSRSGNSI